VTYALARSGGAATTALYFVAHIIAALVAEDRRMEAVPAIVAPIEELALEEAVVLPAVPAENPGVCTLYFLTCVPANTRVSFILYIQACN
jgi:hypothetical protein